MTAAHCVDRNPRPSGYTVVVGKSMIYQEENKQTKKQEKPKNSEKRETKLVTYPLVFTFSKVTNLGNSATQ